MIKVRFRFRTVEPDRFEIPEYEVEKISDIKIDNLPFKDGIQKYFGDKYYIMLEECLRLAGMMKGFWIDIGPKTHPQTLSVISVIVEDIPEPNFAKEIMRGYLISEIVVEVRKEHMSKEKQGEQHPIARALRNTGVNAYIEGINIVIYEGANQKVIPMNARVRRWNEYIQKMGVFPGKIKISIDLANEEIRSAVMDIP